MKKIYFVLILILYASFTYSQQSKLLEKYREMAMDYNHDLKAAEKNIAASMELEKSARTDLMPKLSGDINFQHVGNPYEINKEIPALENTLHLKGRDTKYGASVSLSQPIYTGGRILESIRIAQHQHSLAAHQAEAFCAAVCYQTDIQYWNTVTRLEILGVTTEFRNSIVSLVQIIGERVDVGLVDQQDLLMAEVKLNEAEYQLLQAESNFNTGCMALNSLIGLDLHNPTEIDQSIPQVIPTKNIWSSDGVNRPEKKIAYDQIKIAESSLKLSDSKYKPQLYIGLDGNYSSPGYDFRSDLDPNYAVYAKLSVPLFEWGKRQNEKRASAYKIDMATDNLHKVEDNINLEIQVARVSLTQAMERVRLSESSLEKARENERKAMERYAEGKASVIEVIDAQTYRQTSQMNYVYAKAAAQSYYSELIKALNGYNCR